LIGNFALPSLPVRSVEHRYCARIKCRRILLEAKSQHESRLLHNAHRVVFKSVDLFSSVAFGFRSDVCRHHRHQL
jgi:hypothetical protein